MQAISANKKITQSLSRWREMVAARDLSALPNLIHPDALFRSPVAHKPYEGRDALVLVLSTASDLFEDFAYYREFATADGKNTALEFSARIGDKQLKGVDVIKFNDDGLIVEFEVMIRPASALAALGEEMKIRVGAKLNEFKRHD